MDFMRLFSRAGARMQTDSSHGAPMIVATAENKPMVRHLSLRQACGSVWT